jgi:AcrR family transcriptional regulator
MVPKTQNKNNRNDFTSRQQQIVEVASRLFVKNSYHKTTVREIARESGLTVGTLYHYFSSKEAILTLILEKTSENTKRIAQEVEEVLSQSGPTQALRLAIEKYYSAVNKGQDQILFWYHDTRALSQEQRRILLGNEDVLANIFNEVLIAGCKEGEFREHDTLLMSHNIIVLGDMWAFRRWFLRDHCGFEEYLKTQVDMILLAISN